MDLLACPIDKTFPLHLVILEEKALEGERHYEKVLCELYCGRHKGFVKELQLTPRNCEACMGEEIAEGVLTCPTCGRWYPIIDEIPHMLPDDLRNEGEDLSFLARYRDRLPEIVIREGKPFRLAT